MLLSTVQLFNNHLVVYDFICNPLRYGAAQFMPIRLATEDAKVKPAFRGKLRKDDYGLDGFSRIISSLNI